MKYETPKIVELGQVETLTFQRKWGDWADYGAGYRFIP